MPINNDDVEYDDDGDDDGSEILVNIALFHKEILCWKKTKKTTTPAPFFSGNVRKNGPSSLSFPFPTFSYKFQFWEQRSGGQSAVLTLMDLQIETQIGRNWNNSFTQAENLESIKPVQKTKTTWNLRTIWFVYILKS